MRTGKFTDIDLLDYKMLFQFLRHAADGVVAQL